MGLSTEDGLDWFKQAGIELTPEQEAKALAVRAERQRDNRTAFGEELASLEAGRFGA